MHKLVVRIVSIGGGCGVHEVGDFFEVEDDLIRVPPGKHICLWSLCSPTLPLSMSKSDYRVIRLVAGCRMHTLSRPKGQGRLENRKGVKRCEKR